MIQASTDSAFDACGAEIPLGPNLQLARLEETTSSVELWDAGLPNAFRYSFVPVPSSSLEDMPTWATHLRALIGGNVRVVVAWRSFDSGPFRIRSLAVGGSLRRVGWKVMNFDGVGLASKEISSFSVNFNLPDSCKKNLQGFFLLLGDSLPLEALSASPFAASVKHFSIAQRLQPSVEFVRGVCEQNAFVAYVSTASDTQHGVVFIGATPMAPDIDGLQRQGFFERVYWNREAPSVWSRSQELSR